MRSNILKPIFLFLFQAGVPVTSIPGKISIENGGKTLKFLHPDSQDSRIYACIGTNIFGTLKVKFNIKFFIATPIADLKDRHLANKKNVNMTLQPLEEKILKCDNKEVYWYEFTRSVRSKTRKLITFSNHLVRIV